MKNERLPLRIQNHTNYFIPGKDRTHITVANPNSWSFGRSKVQGYEQRLYWEYKFTEKYGGQTFFFTLTYNDKALPHDHWLNRPCFDYEHLRDLFEGGFRKQLLRKYGSTFKYFVGAELGEGAGSRGMSNNPHYHVLFFVRSAQNFRYPYIKISEKEFTHLIRMYWQGFDQDNHWQDYRTAKYGIAKPGKYGAVVTGRGNACFYCAKYCTKDAHIRKSEYLLKKYLHKEYSKRYDDPDIIDSCIKEDLSYYRNRYSNKVRISHGVGYSPDSVKDFLTNPMNPYIKMPGDNDWDYQPISLFYYRKLYTDVVKDPNTGNNLYVLNNLGLAYRKHQLPKQLAKAEQRVRTNLMVLDRKLYDHMLYSSCNEDDTEVNVVMSYNKFTTLMNHFDKNVVIKRYAEFKLVYENRWFQTDRNRCIYSYTYPPIDVFNDFGRFLVPSFFKGCYDPFAVTNFVYSDHEGYSSYSSHPYFSLYRELFRVFDLLDNFLFYQSDKLAQERAEEVKEINKFHQINELVEYYKQFKLC